MSQIDTENNEQGGRETTSFLGQLISFTHWIFFKHTFYSVSVAFLTGSSLVLINLNRLKETLVETAAIENAELYSQALTEFRTIYTKDVVKVVKSEGIEVTHDYETKKGAIPLPATLSMKLGEKIGAHQSGAETKLYSPYPFPWRGEIGKFRDTFSKDAWEALSQNPETPFYRFESYKGRLSLRYARADLMRGACINCHNTHPQTPKKGWKVGDLRGVLEVIHPIDVITANTEDELEETFLITASVAGLGLFMLVIIIKKLRKNTLELKEAHGSLEDRVERRTKDLKKAYSELETETHQREAMQRDLLQSEKMASVGQLAGGIGHEINTPIQYIGDNLKFLKTELTKIINALDECSDATKEDIDLEFLKEEIPNATNQSIDGVMQVAKLVRSMKEFAHPGGHEKKLMDVNRAIENVVNISKNEWKYAAEIELQFDENLPHVPCLHGEFNQIILNLLINSVHAIEEKISASDEKAGTITFRTSRLKDYIEIMIQDTGAGIPENIRSKIFELFFTTKEIGKGTGQGLSIAHDLIVKKLDGSITVESEVGCGTTFIITLPVKNEGDT